MSQATRLSRLSLPGQCEESCPFVFHRCVKSPFLSLLWRDHHADVLSAVSVRNHHCLVSEQDYCTCQVAHIFPVARENVSSSNKWEGCCSEVCRHRNCHSVALVEKPMIHHIACLWTYRQCRVSLRRGDASCPGQLCSYEYIFLGINPTLQDLL